MSSSSDKKPVTSQVEQPPKEPQGACAPKEQEIASNEIPKFDTRMTIVAGPNACEEGYQRNDRGECVPIFLD